MRGYKGMEGINPVPRDYLIPTCSDGISGTGTNRLNPVSRDYLIPTLGRRKRYQRTGSGLNPVSRDYLIPTLANQSISKY